jgi:hypothetical protein
MDGCLIPRFHFRCVNGLSKSGNSECCYLFPIWAIYADLDLFTVHKPWNQRIIRDILYLRSILRVLKV